MRDPAANSPLEELLEGADHFPNILANSFILDSLHNLGEIYKVNMETISRPLHKNQVKAYLREHCVPLRP